MQLPFISPLFHYFKVFYGYAGKNLYLLFLVILLGGISEGVGISILLPILNFESKSETLNAYSRLVYSLLESIGLGVSLFSLLILLFVAFLLKGVFYFTQASLTTYICSDLARNIRIGFSKKYAAMNYSYYTNTNIGYLNNVVTIETDRAVSGLQTYIRVIVAIIFISVYISSAFIINWNVTLLVLVISAAIFISLRKLSRSLRKMSIFVSDTNARIQSLLIQLISNFKYLKATDTFNYLLKALERKINENYNYSFKSGIIQAIPMSIVEPTTILFSSGLILYYVGYKGQTMAEIMILLLFFYRAFLRVFGFQDVWQKFNMYIGGIEVVRKTTEDLHIHKEISGLTTIDRFQKEISLRNVNFSYGSRQILSDINLIIPRNRSIGIVGESGAGKTTLFDILAGLIAPQSGDIFFDDINYRELNIANLRSKIGYITQEPVIFNDTLANNISFWKCDYRDETCKKRVKRAAEMANCLAFINKTEDAFNTSIGDKGIKLSGGQRQRIAIARELFKEPEIMIFDEATSSLDTESEQLIQESINSLRGKHTIVIIAHRLSTIRSCDYIYVLHEGQIIEEGTFDSLNANNKSVFFRMCLAQNL